MRHNGSHSPGPSELERARMRRVLSGLPETKRVPDAFAESVFSELRAMRTEVESLRELLSASGAANNQTTEEILTRGQVAELLGVCSESVTKLVRRGLPCRRVGKEYRFLKSEVIGWLGSRGDTRPAEE